METLLVIDDEPGIRTTIQEVLQSNDLRILSAPDRATGLAMVRDELPHIVLLDIRLGKESGIDLFQEIREQLPKCLVIFITGHGTTDTAIETMKLGAFDYLVKPLDLAHLQHVVEQALKISRLMHAPALVDGMNSSEIGSDRLIGNGSAMQLICKQIGRIAPQDVNVLILGESGTGKELVARAIYQHSRRHQAPLLEINCAAIPEPLLESELFGHEKGAFTGADRRRIGKFEQCHNGTIFLDEVGDMPLATQAKILRLLQGGQFQRVGGNETLITDVRIIAATNQNLEAMIETGTFRRDLFYRLRGITLHLPPLRERIDDIAELAHYFLFRFNHQLGTSVQSISQESLDKLLAYHWPGNIRELQSVIREALIVTIGPTILPEFLPIEIKHNAVVEAELDDRTEIVPLSKNAWSDLGERVERLLNQQAQLENLPENSLSDAYRLALKQFDQLVVNYAMKLSHGHQTRAAEILGLSRPTLRAKLRNQ